MKNQQLTTLKIDKDLFEEFKIECVRYKFSLQKLAERSMHLFMTNPEFRKQIISHIDLTFEKK